RSAAPTRDLHSFPTRRSPDLGLLGFLLSYFSPCGKRGLVLTSAHMPALVGARGFGGNECTCLRVHYDTTAVGEVNVVNGGAVLRSEEHTSELQSRGHLVCRLL